MGLAKGEGRHDEQCEARGRKESRCLAAVAALAGDGPRSVVRHGDQGWAGVRGRSFRREQVALGGEGYDCFADRQALRVGRWRVRWCRAAFGCDAAVTQCGRVLFRSDIFSSAATERHGVNRRSALAGCGKNFDWVIFSLQFEF